ncbi:hypothetical protein AC578_5751 [Pseudocercospora eumusae]|uniref:Fungal calcium binding protein domain-containing protein n=1 Tax=Pseudocercospora eumusae TaxID=321146 RepID=A0A139H575_9PEZI|nr:hypothetical protein AC578_5751 [Pseudocercospora eumusae]
MKFLTLSAAAFLVNFSGVLCDDPSAAAAVAAISALLEAISSATASASTPTYTPEQQSDPNDCTTNVMGCAEAANAAHTSCQQVSDCVGYCQSILGTSSDVSPACMGNYDPDHVDEGPKGNICTCWNSQGVADVVTHALIAVGETACFVWDEAFAQTAYDLTLLGKLPDMKALAWAGKILKVGNKFLAHGNGSRSIDLN